MIQNLSTRLKQLRLDRHLRQDQVARLINVDPSAICTYENDTRQPSYDILLRLANLYRVSTDYLLGQTNIRTVELADLTEKEATMICELVEMMSKKNQLLNSIDIYENET